MEEYPANTLEFEEQFATEQACRDYLWRIRFPDGFSCPRCNCESFWTTSRGLYCCRQCEYQLSPTAGTIFQGTRKPLRLWFRAIWYVVGQKYGVSALGLQRALGLGSYRTAWTWMHKLRRAMVRPGRDQLRGTLEVDETYVGGKKKGKTGRGAKGKSLVVVAAEEDGNRIGRIRLCRVPDASADSLEEVVKQTVKPGSTIRTDGWRSYGNLDDMGYEHDVVRQSADVGDNPLPLVNRVIALLKRWLLGTHQGAIQPEHLDYYLDEYTFRFNRRTSRSRGKLFYRLMQQAVVVGAVPGNQIEGSTAS